MAAILENERYEVETLLYPTRYISSLERNWDIAAGGLLEKMKRVQRNVSHISYTTSYWVGRDVSVPPWGLEIFL